MLKKIIGVIAVLGLVAVAVASVGLMLRDPDSPERERSSGSRTPRQAEPPTPEAIEPPSPGLADLYAQGIEWEVCESNDSFDCATIQVPVDYRKPRGETFGLNLLRVPADGEPIGSLVVNPGGPGAPGTTYASMAGMAFRSPLLENFDVVGFDPRGTGSSSPVDCLTDSELDAYLAMDPSPDDEWDREVTAEMATRYGRGCGENTGEILGHVTTAEAARDMDVLRAALGEEALTYFGASYGTKLGATYAELFPDRVGRLVLDGAVDLTADSRTLSLEQAAGFETALRAYVENCLESSDSCFLGDSLDEGLGTIKNLLDDIEEEPLPAGDRELQVGNAFYGVVAPLYNQDMWVMLSAALRTALRGDGSLLLGLGDMYASRNPDGSYADNSMEANYVINCLDDPSSVPLDEIPSHFDDFDEASPTFGRIFAWGLVGCAGLPVTSSEKPLDIKAEGAAPILVLGTTRDPATPMKWAESMADQLDSGVLVRRDGDGHTAYNAGNDCINEIVEGYLVDGDVPDDGTTC